MQSTNHPRRQSCWIILGFFLGVAAVLPVGAQTQTGNTALIISGPEADPITLGASFYYTPADGTFTLVKELNPTEDGISIWFQGGPVPGVLWDVGFWAPIGQLLQVAEYDNCVSRGGGDTVGGLDVSGYGIGCDISSGSFIVHELVRDVDGTIEAFHISFQRSCAQSPGAPLAGEIFYNSSHQLPPRPTPVPTAAPGQLTTFTVSVSPKQIAEGEDAVFTFTAKPALAVRSSVGITERLSGPPINGTWPVTHSVEFGPGVTTRHVTLHTVATGQTGKNSQWKVSLLRIPVYKVGTPSLATVTVTRPHRKHGKRN